jgi:PAS domain S-box-containing protein
MDEGLVITDTNDHIVFVNRRMLELLGYTEEEMLGRLTPDMLMPEADRERFAARMARRRAGIAERYDVMLQRRDGTNVWAEVSGVPLQNASGEFIGTLGTYTDITQRRAHQEELVRARDEAQAANRAKTDFLSRMSHELRTPLNSVIGFANVLRRNRRGHLDAEEMNYLERILSNGRHLLALVNNVLDIAKVEAGRLSVEVEQVDVAALVRDVVEQLAGQPRAEGVELRAEIPEGVDPLPSDPFLLRQVLINLTANALKFTQAGHVAVTLRVDPATHLPARIDVEDTGVGIAPDRLAAIFEPFEQEEKFTNRYFGGTGLGLSISKAICDALGFQLEVTSEKGRGSVFSVVMEPPPSPDT